MKALLLTSKAILLTGLISALSPSQAAVQSYVVSSAANIFSAGLTTPIDPSGGGAGILPLALAIDPSQTAFQFSASGTITENNIYGVYHGPDGRLGGFGEQVYAYGGISGIVLGQNTPLVGVFLGASVPGSTPPPTLDFSSTGLGTDFLTLAPAIGQVFFIGDGQTSHGAVQTFLAPSGATRLFLGIPDTVNGLGYPGGYADNAGSFSVGVIAVPEPAVALWSAACVALWLRIARAQVMQSTQETNVFDPIDFPRALQGSESL